MMLTIIYDFFVKIALMFVAFSLPSQGNIYSLSPLTDAQGYTKLLVASLQRKASISETMCSFLKLPIDMVEYFVVSSSFLFTGSRECYGVEVLYILYVFHFFTKCSKSIHGGSG